LWVKARVEEVTDKEIICQDCEYLKWIRQYIGRKFWIARRPINIW
jgi:hypothetical protein